MSEDNEYFLIPINGSIDRSVAVPLSQQTLADQALVEKLVAALASEAAPLDNWHRLAIELFRRGHTTKFQQIAGFLFTPEAEHALKTIYAKSQPALIKLLACLIAFHAYSAYSATSAEIRNEHLRQARAYVLRAESISAKESNFWVAKSLLMIMDQQYNSARGLINARLEIVPNDELALMVKAGLELQEENYVEASKIYQQVLRNNPSCSPSVRLGVGICAYNLGHLDVAINAFKRTCELDETNVFGHLGLAITLLESLHSEIIEQEETIAAHKKEFAKHLEKAYDLDPTNPFTLTVLVHHYCSVGDLNAASEILTKLKQQLDKYELSKESHLFKLQSLYHHYNAHLQHVQSGIAACTSDYESAYRMWSNNVKILFGFGQTCLFRGFIDKTVEAFNQIRAAGQNSFEVLRILGSAQLLQKDYDNARLTLKKAISLNPGDVELLVEYAQVCEKFDLSEACEAYMKAIDFYRRKRDGQVPYQLLNNYSAALFSQGKFSESEQFVHEAHRMLGESKVHPSLFYNLGLVHETKGDLYGACRVYQGIIDSPENQVAPYVDAYLRIGAIKETVGDYAAAESYYKDVLNAEESDERGIIALGNLWLNRTDKEDDEKLIEAESHFNQLPPNHDYAQLSLAAICLKRFQLEKRKKQPAPDNPQNLRKAFEIYSSALQRNPTNSFAVNGLAVVCACAGEYDHAHMILKEIQESSADFASYLTNMGHVQLKKGANANALKNYENGSQNFYQNLNSEMLTFIARAHFLENELNACKKALSRALLLNPDDMVVRYNIGYCCEDLAVSEIRSAESTNIYTSSQLNISLSRLALARRLFADLAAAEGAMTPVVFAKVKSHSEGSKEQYSKCAKLVHELHKKHKESEKLMMSARHKLEKKEKVKLEIELRKKAEEEEERARQEQAVLEMRERVALDFQKKMEEAAKSKRKKTEQAESDESGEDAEEKTKGKKKRKLRKKATDADLPSSDSEDDERFKGRKPKKILRKKVQESASPIESEPEIKSGGESDEEVVEKKKADSDQFSGAENSRDPQDEPRDDAEEIVDTGDAKPAGEEEPMDIDNDQPPAAAAGEAE